MVTTEQDIVSLIPQRPPFVMIDEIVYSDENSTRSSFVVKASNIFVANNVLQEPGLVENIAQTAAARAGYNAKQENKPVRLGYIGAIKNLQVNSLPAVNETITTEITIVHQVFDVSVISGKIICNNIVLAQCEMKIFITNQ
jgi:predicted hotdog family 3-hydroxylacyl-ACP dehydratase